MISKYYEWLSLGLLTLEYYDLKAWNNLGIIV